MDLGYRLLAAKFVRKQAQQLLAQFKGLRRSADIEYVHRARVASRRLGAATQMFGECFKRGQVKRWTKAIRRIRSELSEARDKDVQIEVLCEILASLTDKTCFLGVARLLANMESQRERLQTGVVKSVKRIKRQGVLKEMAKEAKKILTAAKANPTLKQTHAGYARAEQEILERLEGLLSLEDCLSRPDDQQSHHLLRIAAKRLRYTIEIVRPIYSDGMGTVLEAIKKLQTLLGEIHDCDVWQTQLDSFAGKERKRIISLYGNDGPFQRLKVGIEFLRENRSQRRRQCFAELMRFWAELEERALWDKLMSIVQADGDQNDASAPSLPRIANGEKISNA
ncbi:MAG: CHAD domain-containing protein [Thermoguttaceae bacterium]